MVWNNGEGHWYVTVPKAQNVQECVTGLYILQKFHQVGPHLLITQHSLDVAILLTFKLSSLFCGRIKMQK